MINKLRFFRRGIVVSCMFLMSCSTNVEDYQGLEPQLSIDDYFNGPVIAWGMVQDYSKKVTRRFCVTIQGDWQQNIGTLDETFYFADGEKSKRIWTLIKSPNAQYSGTANDVNGTATGKSVGYAFQWRYQLTVAIDGSDYEFAIDDWMYQLDKYRVFNRSTMSKFGINVAEITLFFDKEQPLRQCDADVMGGKA